MARLATIITTDCNVVETVFSKESYSSKDCSVYLDSETVSHDDSWGHFGRERKVVAYMRPRYVNLKAHSNARTNPFIR